jgi:hypothetical protein
MTERVVVIDGDGSPPATRHYQKTRCADRTGTTTVCTKPVRGHLQRIPHRARPPGPTPSDQRVAGGLRPTAHCIGTATAISCYDTKWMTARRRAPGRRHPGGVSCSVIASGRHCQRPRTRSDRGFEPRPLTQGHQATPPARSPPVDLPGRSRPRGSAPCLARALLKEAAKAPSPRSKEKV